MLHHNHVGHQQSQDRMKPKVGEMPVWTKLANKYYYMELFFFIMLYQETHKVLKT
jgi:hypothetical protein